MRTAAEMAGDLEAGAKELMDYITSLSDEESRTKTDAEGWPINVVGNHVGIGARFVADFFEHVANGGDITWTRDFIDEANAQHAEAFAEISKEDALATLQEHMPAVASRIRALTEDQMTRQVETPMDYGDTKLTCAGDIIENMLVNHVRGHLANIKAVVPERS